MLSKLHSDKMREGFEKRAVSLRSVKGVFLFLGGGIVRKAIDEL